MYDTRVQHPDTVEHIQTFLSFQRLYVKESPEWREKPRKHLNLAQEPGFINLLSLGAFLEPRMKREREQCRKNLEMIDFAEKGKVTSLQAVAHGFRRSKRYV